MHIQLHWHQDENTLKAEENWTWSEKNPGCSSQGNTAGSWQGFQLMGVFAKESREGEDVERRKTSKSQAEEI